MHNFSEIFEYTTTSPTFLVNKVNRSPRALAGEPAGTRHRAGFQINLKGTIVQTARVIWELHNGPIPEGMVIIFKDRDAFNCSIENLALVTRRQKGINSQWKGGKSGHIGIHENDNGDFVAHIKMNGSTTYLGTFGDIDKAIAARKSAIKATKGFVRGVS